jgi:glycosyltransferase involved in cell wall biosynthesis
VYASHYEGFGLPLLEAMSCATPVIYGDNSSMPEIVGDAGLAVDSHDTAAMAGHMKRLVTDDHLAQKLGQRALARSRKFTWDRAARETLEAYRDVLG